MYKAIIIDDEERIVKGLTNLLPWQKNRVEVVATAMDGIDAINKITTYKPDIVFTDIHMPRMDGLAMIAAIRCEIPNAQISILSGYPDFKYAQEAIRLGASRFIVKPSKMSELEEALEYMVKQLDQKQENEQEVDVSEMETELEAQNFVVNHALRYIREHYQEKLTLPEVAEKVYVSQWHLSKLISRVTGKNFNEILNGVRIEHAKKLLEDPSLKIWEISAKVGFTDATHFSRIFKKMEGISANEYRNQLMIQSEPRQQAW